MIKKSLQYENSLRDESEEQQLKIHPYINNNKLIAITAIPPINP